MANIAYLKCYVNALASNGSDLFFAILQVLHGIQYQVSKPIGEGRRHTFHQRRPVNIRTLKMKCTVNERDGKLPKSLTVQFGRYNPIHENSQCCMNMVGSLRKYNSNILVNTCRTFVLLHLVYICKDKEESLLTRICAIKRQQVCSLSYKSISRLSYLQSPV